MCVCPFQVLFLRTVSVSLDIKGGHKEFDCGLLISTHTFASHLDKAPEPVHPTFGKTALSSLQLISSHNANRSSLCWRQRIKPPLTIHGRQRIKKPREPSQESNKYAYFKKRSFLAARSKAYTFKWRYIYHPVVRAALTLWSLLALFRPYTFSIALFLFRRKKCGWAEVWHFLIFEYHLNYITFVLDINHFLGAFQLL